MQSSLPDSGSGDALPLRKFTSTQTGATLHAPNTWQDASDDKVFAVMDPESGAQISVSAYANPGITLEQWAAHRFQAMRDAFSGMELEGEPYAFEGMSWKGIVSEYAGLFSHDSPEVYCIVVCIVAGESLLSVTLTAEQSVFLANDELFRWLLSHQFDVGAAD